MDGTKLLIIGLDCASPQFVFDQYREELPHLRRLMSEGVYGKLESTHPPITVPAWASMLTGKDPGQLGLYGFRNRSSYGYDDLFLANASHVRETPAWQVLSDAGFKVILLGIPQTYPPRPVNGIMVSGFLAPNKNAPYIYPGELAEEIDRLADGDYMLDVKDFRTDDKEWLLDQIVRMTKRRFQVATSWAKSKEWDFFMLVEMGLDRMHHGFWRYADPSHRLYQPGNPYAGVIEAYYQLLDREIGLLLQTLPADASVMVVSDHGARRMEGSFCINDWLIQEGFLTLRQPVSSPTKLTPGQIDWSHTRAWGEGGYYARLFLNVQGREPQGALRAADYESFRQDLSRRLEAVLDDQGRPMGNRVLKPEEAYRAVRNIAPDLMVYLGDLRWRAAGTVGNPSLYLFENDTGPDDANHAQHGIFVLYDPSRRLFDLGYAPGQLLEGLRIYDVAPTILDYYGLPIPEDMIGRSVYRGTPGEAQSSPRYEPAENERAYSPEDEEEIRRRLEDLGYI